MDFSWHEIVFFTGFFCASSAWRFFFFFFWLSSIFGRKHMHTRKLRITQVRHPKYAEWTLNFHPKRTFQGNAIDYVPFIIVINTTEYMFSCVFPALTMLTNVFIFTVFEKMFNEKSYLRDKMLWIRRSSSCRKTPRSDYETSKLAHLEEYERGFGSGRRHYSTLSPPIVPSAYFE